MALGTVLILLAACGDPALGGAGGAIPSPNPPAAVEPSPQAGSGVQGSPRDRGRPFPGPTRPWTIS
ncbi:MAG TPA: hypothetical protein VNO17_12075, partial [Actinomycetota bacterium]|nr:hypothetical protein [Actinomycetota bacterium]